MQIHCSTHSVILSVLGHTVHLLTQWHLLFPLTNTVSHHCSYMHIPVHFLWPSIYIDVMQTILVILRMAGLVLDIPDRICTLLFLGGGRYGLHAEGPAWTCKLTHLTGKGVGG